MNKTLTLKKVLLLSCLIWASCGGGDGGFEKIKSSLPSESPGGFDPTGGVPAPTETPTETCTTTEEVTYSPKTVDFGLNQISTRECQTVTMNPCFTVEALIDPKSSQSEIKNPEDETQTTQVPEFEVGEKTGSGQAEICYNRNAIGSHSGKAIIKLNGSYTISVPLKGQTLPEILTITKPLDQTLVWESSFGPPKKGGDNVPYHEYFDVPFEGRVDVTKYASLLKDKKKEITVSVSNGGITQKVPYDEQGRYSGTLQIPNVGREYPVVFSVATTKGNLSKTVRVIRVQAPSITLEVRNQSNGIVNVVSSGQDTQVSITNDTFLKAGLIVNNLPVAGPNAQHPVFVQFKITKANPKKNTPKILVYKGGEDWVSGDTQAQPEEIAYYKGFEEDNPDSINNCKDTFTKGSTICVPLPHTGKLGQGVNTIDVIACNEVTGTQEANCSKSRVNVVVNNNLPRIVIQSPTEHCVYPISGKNTEMACAAKDKGDVILRGFVDNYAPLQRMKEGKLEKNCAVSFWLNQSDMEANRLKKPGTETPYCPIPEVIEGDTVDGSYQQGNQGNIKRGHFEINLTKDYPHLLTRYTNLIQIRAENVLGHVTYRTISFQRGKFNPGSTKDRGNVKDVISGQLGYTSVNGGKTKRAPVMLNITDDTLNMPELKAVIEKFLNDPEDGIQFADVVQGGKLPGDEDGDNQEDSDETINFEKTLNIPAGKTFWNFTDPNDKAKKTWIWQNLHASMPQKARALTRYRTYQGLKGEASQGNLENVFFDGQCNENDPTNFESGWNVACDSCGNRITTALVPYDTMKYIFEGISDVNRLPKRRDWPEFCGDDLNCNDMVQGKWKIGDIKLKANGYIDADVCIVGKGDVVDGCDDVPDTNKHEPAFWGHMAAISLIKGGITELENDPLLPLIWNVGKVRISLKDALQIKKIKLEDGTYTNKIIIHKSKLADGIAGSIQLDPFLQCADYHRNKYGDDLKIPFGCGDSGYIYPVLIDRNTLAGELAWADLGMEGKNPWLLTLLRDKLLATFKNMIHCLVEEVANPMINPDAFAYPPWVLDGDKVDLNIAIEKDDDGEGVKVSQLKDAKDPILTLLPNIKDADIIGSPEGLKLKLPLSFGANNVDLSKFNPKLLGHLFRDPNSEFDNKYPLTEVQDHPYLSLSLGLEEVLHSATSVVLKKGIWPLLDLLDVDDFTPPAHHPLSDWEIGLDSVILGRLDICGDIANKLLSTTLPPSILFSEIKSLFEGTSSHWDIKLDPNAPITLNMKPIDVAASTGEEAGPTSSAILELGLSNAQIEVHDFISTSETKEVYKIGKNPVVTIRLDALIRLQLDYYREQRKLIINISPYDQIPAYATVIERGPAYDDAKVLKDIKETLLKQTFDRLSSGQMEVTFPNNLSGFNTVGFGVEGSEDILEAIAKNGVVILDKTNLGKNGSCEGKEKPVYDTKSSSHPFMTDNLSPHMQTALGYISQQNSVSSYISPDRFTLRDDFHLNTNPNVEYFQDGILDPCKKPDMISEIAGNDIKESFCDLGIKEVSMGANDPNIVFDTTNGYLHLSTKIIIEVFDWLIEANQ